MKNKNPLPDYYPAYKDIAELAMTGSPEDYPENRQPDNENFNTHEIRITPDIESALMFDTEELMVVAFQSNLSAFQAHILLLKNTFEGHAFLAFNKSPIRIFSEGIYNTNCKTESLIGSFFEQIDYYLDGLRNGWKMILENEEAFRGYQPDKSLKDLCFEELLYESLSDQLFRFPVSFFADYDIFRFRNSCSKNLTIARNRFNLIMKGESAFKDFLYVENINKTYSEIFDDQLRVLDFKQNVLLRYDLKLFFAHNLDIRNEEELETRMYEYITENRAGKSRISLRRANNNNMYSQGKNKTASGFELKTRSLYRSASINCREANDNPECESRYPELFRSYHEKEKVNREIVYDTPGALLKYLRMLHILSEITVYRKTHGLPVYEGSHSYPDATCDEPLSEADFATVINEMENMVAFARINNRIDAKSDYISDEFMIKTHRDYLQKQVEFIDQEILNIQEDIRNILKSK